MAVLKKIERFHLTTGDFDFNDNITPFGVLNLFQEIAGNHAEELGIGFQATYEQGMIWILAKNKYEVVRFPHLSEVVDVITWPKLPNRFDCEREYQIRNLDGEILVKGISKWCVIDINTMRLVPSSRVSFPGEFLEEKNFLESPFVFIETNLEEFKEVLTYRVRPSDIDHNKHMNNANYVKVVYDALDIKNEKIQDIQIDYNNQCFLGEEFRVYLKKVEDYAIVLAIKNETEQVFKAKVRLI